jgi:hypothetical protein
MGRKLAIQLLSAILLASCAGTELNPSGTTHIIWTLNADGSESIEIHDGKDRAGMDATLTNSDGTVLHITSTDINGSTAQAGIMAAQASAIDKLVSARGSRSKAAGEP